MRVLFFGDATSIHIHRWKSALEERGIEIKLVTPDKNGGIYFPYPSKRDIFKDCVNFRHILFSFRPHLIHIHYLPTSWTNITRYAGLKKIVLSIWGGDIWGRESLSWKDRFYRAYLLRHAAMVISPSFYLIKKALEYTRLIKKWEIIPTGVDTGFFKRKRGKKRMILFPKHLEERYGGMVLLRAMEKVKERFPEVVLYMTGRGEAEEEWRRFAERKKLRVVFTGDVPHEKMRELYEDAWVVVVPSLVGEGLPVSVLEASSMEVPVVGSALGGIKEAVVHGETGFLFEPGNSEELARYLIKLLENKKLADRMGRKGRERVKMKFEWKRCTERMIEVYRRIL